MSLARMQFGLAAEVSFDAQCARRGIVCAKPESAFGPIDRIVTANGRHVSVQIKATQTASLDRKGKGKVRLRYIASNRRETAIPTTYHDSRVDVIALYVAKLDRWHLFPASWYTGKRIKVSDAPSGRMKAAIENWQIFG